jgi:hypothetical protein
MTKKKKSKLPKVASPPPKKNNLNGKGDSPRSNASKDFKNNYDSIDWEARKK